MNKAQFQAYQELVNKLLKCPSGKKQEILTTYQNLLNKDLIVVMKNDRDATLTQNGSILGFSFATSIIAGILFGLVAMFLTKLVLDR